MDIGAGGAGGGVNGNGSSSIEAMTLRTVSWSAFDMEANSGTPSHSAAISS